VGGLDVGGDGGDWVRGEGGDVSRGFVGLSGGRVSHRPANGAAADLSSLWHPALWGSNGRVFLCARAEIPPPAYQGAPTRRAGKGREFPCQRCGLASAITSARSSRSIPCRRTARHIIRHVRGR